MQIQTTRHPEQATATRRSFLESSTLAVAGLATANLLQACAAEPTRQAGVFLHRGYNGWITDRASNPDPHAPWPSLRIDERLLADYRETFELMRRFGLNEIVIWGLYVANNWPVDIKSAVTEDRAKQVERLIASAHEHGIKVLSGLGTYSWGFANIIRANPSLSGGNPNALCASKPESHAWMHRIVNFVFERFPIDGVSMQSADQGRCNCKQCAKLSDAEYHAELNVRTGDYIHAAWPHKVVGMSNWGLSFGNPKDEPAIIRMSRSLDYMIDHNDSAQWGGSAYRRKLIGSLACAMGTTGGVVVEPPQHWARDRWFLPSCGNVHAHLSELSADGGRACELYYHILGNPSSEVTFYVAGRTLADPHVSLPSALAATLDELYEPRSPLTRDALARLFLDAEQAYMRYQPSNSCGTLSLEPLYSDGPGPAVYLRDHLQPVQRDAYAKDLDRLAIDFGKIRVGLRSATRVQRIDACLKRVQADLRTLRISSCPMEGWQHEGVRQHEV